MNTTPHDAGSKPIHVTSTEPLIVVVMGVSGCGKSTVAQLLAEHILAAFKDGDDLHPAANIEKMANGIPLTDGDRSPWLKDVADFAKQSAAEHGSCVIACSALKRSYRSVINQAGHVVYVFLKGSAELIGSRMHERTGHFMPETLLQSQFAALEDPTEEPNVICIDIDTTAVSVAASAANALRTLGYVKTEH